MYLFNCIGYLYIIYTNAVFDKGIVTKGSQSNNLKTTSKV